MDAATILARFDAEIRADPPPDPTVERVWDGGVLRLVAETYTFIGWWDFPAEAAADIASREAALHRGREVEWKVYSHDRPPGLETALAAAGFQPQERETFVVLDLEAGGLDIEPPRGVDVREITDERGVTDLVKVSEAAFGRDEPGRFDQLVARLGHPNQALFVAYEDHRPISSGRLELAPGRAFAGLYGGGTVPDRQGRGAYRALVAARAAAAKRLGYRYLTVDARETSRPVLQRLGFQLLATVRGWTLG